MDNPQHNEETYYTVDFWNNPIEGLNCKTYKNSCRYASLECARSEYNYLKGSYDNCEVRKYNVNYSVLFGKNGE